MTVTRASRQSRLALMTADQVVSGGSNVLIAILVARLVPVAEFGRFAVIQLVYLIAIGITRALVSDLLLVNPRDAEERRGEALGAIIILSGALALILCAVAVTALVWSPQLGPGLAILAACLPLLALQDVGRFIAFSYQRVDQALLLDVVWLIVMLIGVGAVIGAGSHDLHLLVAIWAGSGALSGLMVFALHGGSPIPFRLDLLRDNWHLGWRYLVMYGSMQAVSLGVVIEVGTLAGAVALGAVQAAVVLVRPFTTVQIAVQTLLTGDVARIQRERRRVLRHALGGSGVMIAIGLVNGAVLLVLPNVIGRQLIGDSWPFVHPLLVPLGLQLVGIGLITGPGAALNGMKAMREVMRVVWVTPPVLLICAGIGVEIDGARGCVWMLGLGQLFIGLLYWLALGVALRRKAVSPAPQTTRFGVGEIRL